MKHTFFRQVLAVPEVGILIPLVVLTVVFYLLNPGLLNPDNIDAILRYMAFIGLIAVGQTFLMISGELDLSVGSVASLCAIVAGWLMKFQDWSVSWAILAGLGAGALAGLVNGLVTIGIGLPAFISTLGMLYIARGFAYLICGGYPIYPLPDSLAAFGTATPLGISWTFMIFLIVAILGDFVLHETIFGRAVYATGGNQEVARLAGINAGGVKLTCFIMTGLLAGLAGILQMAQFTAGQPEGGTGWELAVIASVVIGGVSLFGGVGKVSGTFLGLLIMQVVRSGLVTSDVSTHWSTVAVGVIMIVAVSLDLLRRRAKRM